MTLFLLTVDNNEIIVELLQIITLRLILSFQKKKKTQLGILQPIFAIPFVIGIIKIY